MTFNRQRQAAANPTTPASVLTHLANRCDDRITCQKIVANPNSPKQVLWQLGAEFPEQLLKNPMFSLLFLENHQLIEEIPLIVLEKILRYDTVPSLVLEQAANYPEAKIKLAIASNPITPKPILETLLLSENKYVEELVYLHVNWSGEIEKQWHTMVNNAIEKTHFYYPINRTKTIIYNQLIPKCLFIPFSRHINEKIRTLVAVNPQTQIQILKLLAVDLGDTVRAGVALNPTTPIKLLKWLAEDSSNKVRKAVAANQNTPVKLLKQLANDIGYVRQAVASNPNTPIKVLTQLANDENDWIRRSIALNHTTPVTLLEQLALDIQSVVRAAVAANMRTPVNLLRQLAHDQSWQVRHSVSNNPSTPWQITTILLKQLSTRHCLSFEELELDWGYYLDFANLLETQLVPNYDIHTTDLMRFIMLFNSKISVKIIAKNYRSLDWLERYAISQNPRTPLHILQTLAQDANRIVRAAAKARLDGDTQTA